MKTSEGQLTPAHQTARPNSTITTLVWLGDWNTSKLGAMVTNRSTTDPPRLATGSEGCRQNKASIIIAEHFPWQWKRAPGGNRRMAR